MRMYAFPEGISSTLNPLGNSLVASSLLIDGRTMHSSPWVQLTGVATRFLSVSCRESMILIISLESKAISHWLINPSIN